MYTIDLLIAFVIKLFKFLFDNLLAVLVVIGFVLLYMIIVGYQIKSKKDKEGLFDWLPKLNDKPLKTLDNMFFGNGLFSDDKVQW